MFSVCNILVLRVLGLICNVSSPIALATLANSSRNSKADKMDNKPSVLVGIIAGGAAGAVETMCTVSASASHA